MRGDAFLYLAKSDEGIMMEYLNRTMDGEKASKIKLWHFFAFCLWIWTGGILFGVCFGRLLK